MSLDVFAAIWSVCDCPMHCFAFCTDLLVFALWPDRLHDVDKLAMTEGMKLASAALLGGVETWCKLHDQTLGMGVAGGLFWQPGPLMLDGACTPASDAVVVPVMQRQLSTRQH